MIIAKGITPNQYYLLSSMFDKVQTKNINITLELKQLVYHEYVIVTNENKLIATEKAKKLVRSIEGLFTKLATSSAVTTMGPDYEKHIEEYKQMFPKGRLPSGMLARVNNKANFSYYSCSFLN